MNTNNTNNVIKEVLDVINANVHSPCNLGPFWYNNNIIEALREIRDYEYSRHDLVTTVLQSSEDECTLVLMCSSPSRVSDATTYRYFNTEYNLKFICGFMREPADQIKVSIL